MTKVQYARAQLSRRGQEGYLKLGGFNFMEGSRSAKTAKINTLENFPLYGRCKHRLQARDVQMEDEQAYGDTTEVCLLYVPAHDTSHQSIAVVEMFQRD